MNSDKQQYAGDQIEDDDDEIEMPGDDHQYSDHGDDTEQQTVALSTSHRLNDDEVQELPDENKDIKADDLCIRRKAKKAEKGIMKHIVQGNTLSPIPEVPSGTTNLKDSVLTDKGSGLPWQIAKESSEIQIANQTQSSVSVNEEESQSNQETMSFSRNQTNNSRQFTVSSAHGSQYIQRHSNLSEDEQGRVSGRVSVPVGQSRTQSEFTDPSSSINNDATTQQRTNRSSMPSQSHSAVNNNSSSSAVNDGAQGVQVREITENVPYIVEIHFRMESLIDSIYDQGYFLQSYFFPLMLVGIVFWSIYFSFEVDAISEDYNYKYLVNLQPIGTSEPHNAYFYVYSNIYLYYAQACTDFLIICLIRCYRRAQNSTARNRYQVMDRFSTQIDIFQSFSLLLNIYNVIQMYMLKHFLFSYTLNNPKPGSPFYGYAKWHNLCMTIYDARRHFWLVSFVLCCIFMFIGFMFFSIIAVYFNYERRHGRIYVHPHTLRLREMVNRSDPCRPGVREFVENNKQPYKVPSKQSGFCRTEECLICLCEFKTGDLVNDNESGENELVVILPCGDQQAKKDSREGDAPDKNDNKQNNETLQATALQQTVMDAHGNVELGIKLEDVGIKVDCDEKEQENEKVFSNTQGNKNQKEEVGEMRESVISNNLNKMSRHIFHYKCLKEWIKTRDVCPLCKCTVGRTDEYND